MKLKSLPLLIAMLLLPLSSAFSEVVIRLLERAEISSDEVRLGQIALIGADDESLLKRLSSIRLASAPRPGGSIEITRAHVQVCLEREGVKGAKVEGRRTIVVRRAQIVKPERVLEAVEKFIRESLKLPEEAVVALEPSSPLRELLLPEGEISIRVESLSPDVLRGWLRITFLAAGKPVEELPLFLDIKVERPVVVAVEPIKAGERISADKLKVERRMVGYRESDALSKVEEAVGKVASEFIPKGAIVRKRHLRAPVVVRRGDLVIIVAICGPIKVTARGKAVENGRLGDYIEVENLRSKRRIFAEVVSPGVVMVKVRGEGG